MEKDLNAKTPEFVLLEDHLHSDACWPLVDMHEIVCKASLNDPYPNLFVEHLHKAKDSLLIYEPLTGHDFNKTKFHIEERKFLVNALTMLERAAAVLRDYTEVKHDEMYIMPGIKSTLFGYLNSACDISELETIEDQDTDVRSLMEKCFRVDTHFKYVEDVKEPNLYWVMEATKVHEAISNVLGSYQDDLIRKSKPQTAVS